MSAQTKPNKKQELMEQILRKRVTAMSKEEKLFYRNNDTEKGMFLLSVELEVMGLMLEEINENNESKKS